MENLGQYILSVIIGAMICTIAVSMVPSQQGKTWIRLLCGLILTIIIIKPLTSIRLSEINLEDPTIWSYGESFSALGEEQSRNDLASIIKQRCETYIVDKANSLGVSIRASISLSDEAIPVPVSVSLYGDVNSYLRLRLETMIQEDLGITKENLQWME